MHTIRLRGPWQCQIDTFPVRSIRLPGNEWLHLAGQAKKSFRMQRSFQCPTNLHDEAVRLRVVVAITGAEVSLNKKLLGVLAKDTPCWYEIRSQLRPQNVVEIILSDSKPVQNVTDATCEVSLEIGN